MEDKEVYTPQEVVQMLENYREYFLEVNNAGTQEDIQRVKHMYGLHIPNNVREGLDAGLLAMLAIAWDIM
ncbi:hypothetical protein J4463_00780 [Candidatus Pacearchaeota archaeon]|nr:hypothetical protein [Candidatus Pacearchaeota archaeon]